MDILSVSVVRKFWPESQILSMGRKNHVVVIGLGKKKRIVSGEDSAKLVEIFGMLFGAVPSKENYHSKLL